MTVKRHRRGKIDCWSRAVQGNFLRAKPKPIPRISEKRETLANPALLEEWYYINLVCFIFLFQPRIKTNLRTSQALYWRRICLFVRLPVPLFSHLEQDLELRPFPTSSKRWTGTLEDYYLVCFIKSIFEMHLLWMCGFIRKTLERARIKKI